VPLIQKLLRSKLKEAIFISLRSEDVTEIEIITVLNDVRPHSLLRMFFQNVGTHQPNYTASHFRRNYS
jgi:hypothetical protein